MEGDPRNPKVSLIKKYDIPIEHLSYEYVEKCSNKKELERIIRILRSGEEGSYPDLLKVTEERLRLFAPESRVLRVETPILTKECLTKEEWSAVESELLLWEEEMSVMDKSLDFEKGRIEVVGNKNLPEVRKVVQPPQKSKVEIKSKAEADKNNQRIKSGDYDAWDKFDVDKELLKMDVEEERKQEENEKKKREAKKLQKGKKVKIDDVEKDNYSLMEQQVLANQAKDRGNECFKSGDLESALKYYEISIKLYSTANAYNNRAITYLKLKQYENALKDCNSALHLEKNNVKALYRRATAYQNMPGKKDGDNYDQLALKDLYQIIYLEPNNKAAQADLQNLKKKLNIVDSGKKFRMPISEDLVSNKSSNQNEGKYSASNSSDNIPVEKLPLTYYGPSTSTFQCEPYSMVHRALLGSSTSGQVLCKCNSNRSRQNPLCQRCGEAMSSPKPRKAITANVVKSTSKKENETKNLEHQTDKVAKSDKKSSTPSKDVLTATSKTANDIKNTLIKSSTLQQVNDESKDLANEVKSVVVESEKNSYNNFCSIEIKESNTSNSTVKNTSKDSLHQPDNNLNHFKTVSNNSEKKDICESTSKKIPETSTEIIVQEKTQPVIEEKEKTVESVCNKNSETKITESSSSPSDVNHNSKKSKSKKKKSKEPKESKPLRHLEPVKVVHAAKYLHPTSVEPKIKTETPTECQREPDFSTNFQYKAFVPNRKCYSTDFQRMDSAISPYKKPFSADDDKPNNDLSFEGNKENISENNCNNNVEKKEDDIDVAKKEVVDSAFEFMKTWEELKKFDDSYVKRAEIIRKIRPSDLSKVIGIKLDSDMLSCLLECLMRHFAETDPKRVVELLKQLPQVPRFGLVSMFLADADKKKIKELIETAEGKGFKLDEDVKKNLTIMS